MNVIFRHSGLDSSSSPNADEGPTTIWKTPFGSPAAWTHSANSAAQTGVCVAGFRTTVQPAASAGAILRTASASGKFHGLMAPTTPIGVFTTRWRLLSTWFGTMRP